MLEENTKKSPILEVEGLTVRRADGTALLEDVSLTVNAGEILGLVGESSAGKSMIGNAVAGLLPAGVVRTGGRIALEGREIQNLRPEEIRRIRGPEIGMILQDPLGSLNPLLTVGEHFRETFAAHGVRLCWENVSWCQLTSPERVRAVRRACPHVGFVLDVKQAMQSGFDAVEFAREMGDRLCNVHVCDFDASGRLCLPGRGIYDFAALAMALRAAGYDGPVILEPYANLFREEAELADSLAYLRKTMEIASQKTANRV